MKLTILLQLKPAPAVKVSERAGSFFVTNRGDQRLELISLQEVFNEFDAPYAAKVVGDYTGLSRHKKTLRS